MPRSVRTSLPGALPALLLCLLLPIPLGAATHKAKAKEHKARAPRIHSVGLGAFRPVPYTADPDAAAPAQTQLRIRPLIVDGRIAQWTTGDVHLVTATTFTVREALRVNDSLPTDPHPRWIWQLGPWLLVHRTTGRVAELHLPDFDPLVSSVTWFRDYAAYCGLHTGGKLVYAIVAEVGTRKPLVSKKLSAFDPANHPTPVCAPANWQLDPLRVSFLPTDATPITYSIDNGFAAPVPSADNTTSSVPIP
ncbi:MULTISPECIES: hypothetical protein [Acidobacterium]|uniref:Lipoprotein n=1 Tax=Acidobacterium capsulatum (strain ATCC 51196 / DSM 11244 / BCRC 80197 / JCM 7670 / NBRC 15755 / NCIMB 13165 / 161) TaxID=240015 RepID=C1F850_ACIC5|nr:MULTISPECIES: hypothetical protein [Acidobacterium]ACO32531.1 hypothetical protein ACP_1856 [Acidobacterium capsulatum ATCC 51196]HCT59738.1 hypothetical protein [Acidobacterium sp.]